MRAFLVVAVLFSSGCQLLTNFVRPLADPVDAGPVEDTEQDTLEIDAPDEDGGS